MENLEVLVRGVAMQSSGPGGLGLPRSVMSFQGLELLWVVIVATIVLAVMSVTRVSVLTWGWSKSGSHVRVRVQSFASLADGLTAGGMFSAEIVHSSADSCSEDASSSHAERAGMLFIFNENGASLMTTTSTLPASASPHRLPSPDSKLVTRPIVQEFRKQEVLLASPSPQPVSFPRREGIQWDVNALSIGSLLPEAAPLVCRAPSRVVRNACSSEWDPILKLRIRDAVLSDGGSFARIVPLAPVALGAQVTTLKDDVVRVWDSEERTLMKSVHLGYGGVATAFDVNWESNVAAMAREGGVVSIANLESGVYEECYQTQQSLVQAIHLDTASLPNTVFTGGPSVVNPGCSVSIWDCRSSSWDLSMSLATAIAINSLHSRGPELYVKDEASSVAMHDVRMLGSSPVSRQPCDITSHATQDRWWDIDTGLLGNQDDNDDDNDDDFFDCEERQAAAASYMGQSFVRAVSLNFSAKPASH